jgi:hypothetical protein
VLLAPAALAAIVELLGDAAYAVHHVDGVRALPAALPAVARDADVAVNLHGRGPQSTALLRGAEPRTLVAFGCQAAWRDDEHETTRWCRLLEAAEIPADPRDLDLARARAAHTASRRHHHPSGGSGAGAPLAAERWAAVARGSPVRWW